MSTLLERRRAQFFKARQTMSNEEVTMGCPRCGCLEYATESFEFRISRFQEATMQAHEQHTPICANCGHDKESHWDRYGCQVEGGDVWVEGTNCGGWVASGPCCCKDFEAENAAEALERMREEHYDFSANTSESL